MVDFATETRSQPMAFDGRADTGGNLRTRLDACKWGTDFSRMNNCGRFSNEGSRCCGGCSRRVIGLEQGSSGNSDMGIFRRKVPTNYIPIHSDNVRKKDWIILLEAGTIVGPSAEKLRVAKANLDKRIVRKYNIFLRKQHFLVLDD